MVNRVADKESAKSILKHNGNQAAMIGMEILYTIISTLTVTSMMAAFFCSSSSYLWYHTRFACGVLH